MAVRQTCIKDDNLALFKDVITEEIYRRKKSTIFIVMYDDEENISYGCLGYEMRPYEVEITYIYVNPAYRHQEVGTDLLNTLTGFVFNSPAAVPIYAKIPMRNSEETGLLNFFEMQFNFDVEFSNFVVSFDAKHIIPHLLKTADKKLDDVNFFDLPEQEQNRFWRFLGENDLLMVDDIDSFRESCAKEYCRCVYQNNEITSFICVTNFAENVYEVAYIYTKEPTGGTNAGSYMDLIIIITRMLRELAANNPDAIIQAEILNEETAHLCAKLFNDMNIEDVIAIANWDFMPGIKDLTRLVGRDN